MDHGTFFIGGEWRTPARDERLEVVCPATEEVIGRVPLGASVDIAAAVTAARSAFDRGPWPRMTTGERREALTRAGTLLAERADELDVLISSENGVLRSNHPGQSARAFDYFCSLDLPEATLRTSPTGATAWIVHEPVGVVAAIVPWNGPLWLSLLKLLPALMTGCTAVLKPAPETPLDSYVLAQSFADAGLPQGVVNVVIADREVSEELVRHPDVDLVSFTGSTATGRRIGAICGEQIKRAHLELGGKSAVILLDDVDLSTAAPMALGGGMLMMNGQSCIAWTYILVPEARHDEVVDALCDYLRSVRTGDPLDPGTQVGPLVSSRQRDRVEGYIALAQREGARVAAGGGRPLDLDRGWYVEPTLLVDADNAMRSSREEIFGPVASVIPYRDVAHAVELANDSSYGLSGAVLTADAAAGLDVARQVRTGHFGVNRIGSDLAFPFGGYKESGLGRQNGPEGLLEFMEVRTISLPDR